MRVRAALLSILLLSSTALAGGDPNLPATDPGPEAPGFRSLFGERLQAILDCRLVGLSKRKKKLEAAESNVVAIEATIKTLIENDATAEEGKEGLEKDLANAKTAVADAKSAFGAKEAVELARLQALKAHLDSVRSSDGAPDPYYALQIGAERVGALGEGSPSANAASGSFFFAFPLVLGSFGRAKVKPVDLPSCAPSCGRNETGEALLAEEEAAMKVKIDAARSRDKTDLEQKGAALTEIRKAEDVARKEATAARRALRIGQDCLRDNPSQNCADLRRLLLAADDAEATLAKARAATKAAEKAAAEAKTKKEESDAKTALCEALSPELIARFEDAVLLRDRSRGLVRSKTLLVGPYQIPTTLQYKTVPAWGFTRIGLEGVAAIASEVSESDGELVAAIANERRRFTMTGGLQKFFRLGEQGAAGFEIGTGMILGPIPGETAQHPTTSLDRFFFQVAALLQMNYRVADIDREKKVSRVMAQAYVGYRKARWLRAYQETNAGVVETFDDSDRLVGDFRFGYSALGSKTITPLLYLSWDRSIHGSKRLHRDRVGIMVEIDIQALVGNLGGGLVKSAQDLAKPAEAPAP